MIPGHNSPDEDDIALFRQSIGEVQPVEQDSVLAASQKPRPRPLPRPLQPEPEPQLAREEIPGNWPVPDAVGAEEPLLFQRPGVQNRTLQRLRRGQFTVEAELDLHGMTVAAATRSLATFLVRCKDSGIRCVRIIHGKGHGSKDGKPVIKNRLNQWLRQRDEILAFCSARPADGGAGALYVLMKKTARPPHTSP